MSENEAFRPTLQQRVNIRLRQALAVELGLAHLDKLEAQVKADELAGDLSHAATALEELQSRTKELQAEIERLQNQEVEADRKDEAAGDQ